MSEPTTIKYYRGRRVSWNSVNRLWWFKITTQFGDKEKRCRNTYEAACRTIDYDLDGRPEATRAE